MYFNSNNDARKPESAIQTLWSILRFYFDVLSQMSRPKRDNCMNHYAFLLSGINSNYRIALLQEKEILLVPHPVAVPFDKPPPSFPSKAVNKHWWSSGSHALMLSSGLCRVKSTSFKIRGRIPYFHPFLHFSTRHNTASSFKWLRIVCWVSLSV